jgi:hypothetical protein
MLTEIDEWRHLSSSRGDYHPRRARRRRSEIPTCAAGFAVGLLHILCAVQTTDALKVSDTQAMYTGLVRKVGEADGDTSYILSFGPDNDEVQFRLCMSQGYSGEGLAPDSTSEDPTGMSVRCLKDYEEKVGSSKSAPSTGVSAFDPISQVWFHANGEDGFASAYVTGVNVLKHGSIGQASVENAEMDTSFTLSALEYNRADNSLFGVVTYSSGQHYVVAISGSDPQKKPIPNPLWDPTDTGHESDSPTGYFSASDQRPANKRWNRILTFRHIYRLREATGVVPALSGLEPIRQVYVCIVIEKNDPFLYIVNSGMDQGGNPLGDCATMDKQDRLVCPECSGCLYYKAPMPGVATSLEVYYTNQPAEPGKDPTGFVYMMVRYC